MRADDRKVVSIKRLASSSKKKHDFVFHIGKSNLTSIDQGYQQCYLPSILLSKNSERGSASQKLHIRNYCPPKKLFDLIPEISTISSPCAYARRQLWTIVAQGNSPYILNLKVGLEKAQISTSEIHLFLLLVDRFDRMILGSDVRVR